MAHSLHPAVEVLADQGERTRVIAEAWRRYRPYGSAGLALAGGATVLRTVRAMQQAEGRQGALVALNLACAAAAVGAATASGVGMMVTAAAEFGTARESGVAGTDEPPVAVSPTAGRSGPVGGRVAG